jgi:Protein of unknown function (DUF2786)
MDTNDSVLRKVRALLAKAEATPFDAEAEAFTAKAQELIARYRIDRALLDARESRGQATPVARRVVVEDPYLRAKVVLLSTVARSNDCRAVWPNPLHHVELFGRADDLSAVEELFTSLLLQATVGLRRAGSKQDSFGRSRTAAFRRAFLMSFANRIGHRLRETVDATVSAAAAETGVALVPMFAARGAAAEALAAESFPHSRPLRATVSDAEGWHAGSVFADQADLAMNSKIERGA